MSNVYLISRGVLGVYISVRGIKKKKMEKRKVLLLTGFRGVPSLVDPTVQCVPSFVTYIREFLLFLSRMSNGIL